jgi:hypothetical protein
MCPISGGIDWLNQQFIAEPFEALSGLRARSPVFYDEQLGHYLVTRYEDIERVLRDREVFLAANASASVWPLCEEAQGVLKDKGYRRVPTLNNSDPPRHAPMRKAVRTCMTPRRLNSLEPNLRAFAGGLVDALAVKPIADLRSDLASPLAAHAGLGLLGIPDHEIDQILQWSDRRVVFIYGHLPEDGQVEVAQSVVDFWKFIEDFVRHRNADRRDDFTSDLLRYLDEHPDEVTFDDAVNIVYSMALAGHDSTSNGISNTLRRFLADREHWEQLCSHADSIPNAVEEGLRIDSPLMGHRRLVAQDTEIGGVPVPKGAKIVMLFASANRDGAHFPEPDRIDPARLNASDHLSFGKGVHFCLGAPLARLEIKIVLELLTMRTPRMRLVADQIFGYSPNALFRSLRHLMVEPNPKDRI